MRLLSRRRYWPVRHAIHIATANRWAARSQKEKRRLVYIALTEHLGDIVACEPIARIARNHYPDAVIVWVVQKHFACLLRGHPALDGLLEVGCLSDWLRLAPIVGTHTLHDLHVPGKVCAKEWIHVPVNGNAPGIHAENYYEFGPLLHIACLLGGFPQSDLNPEIPLLATSGSRGVKLPRKARVVLHTVSSSPERDWTADGWRELARWIATGTDRAPVEIGTRSVFPPGFLEDLGGISLTGKTTIPQMTAVIRDASLFIGIDSGPAHLANAAETPAVILLGSFGKFARHMPYTGFFADSPSAKIIHCGSACREIPTGDVLKAVEAVCREPIAATGAT